jgi:single-stranded-DNA-specific exonuclease
VIVEGDPAWHRGVLGIAASRLAREYHRPVLLFGEKGDRAVGSGRSIPGVDLHATLEPLAPFFLEFGGHEQAVGGALRSSRLAEFREAARAHFSAAIPPELLEAVEEAELDLSLESISDDLVSRLAELEPHGAGNPRPVFRCGPASFEGPLSPRGERGLSGSLSRNGRPLAFINWSREALEPLARRGGPVELHYNLRRRRGGAVQAEIVAARPSGTGGVARDVAVAAAGVP